MSKKLSVEEFIEKSCRVHGSKYKYNAVVYKDNKTKVDIWCKKHKCMFSQTPSSHMSGVGCPQCGYEKVSDSLVSSVKDFVEKALELHGDNYDYSRVDYKGSTSKVDLFCNKHKTVFSMRPGNHLAGQGCPTCGDESAAKLHTRDAEQFISMAKSVHGELYDYSNVEYTKSTTPVKIGCGLCGETFEQKPVSHLWGSGCNKCAKRRSELSRRLGKFKFILKATDVHGDKYDYSLVEYELDRIKVNIGCTTCGSHFLQAPSNHLRGAGCPKCGKGGYSSVAPGSLYLLRCGDMTKIGITNKSPWNRANRISKSFGSEFTVFKSWYFEDGQIPLLMETAILRELNTCYETPTNKFEGYSECFIGVDIEALVSKVELKLSEVVQKGLCYA